MKAVIEGRIITYMGRHDDPRAVKCDCGWTGPRMKTLHCYKPDNEGDVEPIDRCPKCREEV
jgi:hypothetical protein